MILKRLLFLGILSLVLITSGCGSSDTKKAEEKKLPTIKVGATAVPHAEILTKITAALEKEGVKMQIVEMNDYVRPNLAVSDGELDANYFQHIPYLEKFAADRKLELVKVANVHIEPMGVYSTKIKNLKEIKENAVVAIPNDPTNGGRALLLLEKANLLKLKPGVGINATKQDIVENNLKLDIKEIEAPQLPRSLDDVTIAVINTNYALDAKLNPTKDALIIEGKDSPYVNILVVKKGNESKPEIQKLAKVLNSPEVKKFIEEQYKGAVVPAF